MIKLIQAIDEHRTGLKELIEDAEDTLASGDVQRLKDSDFLIGVLVGAMRRSTPGNGQTPILKAFGAPGDWGYGTPIGAALLEALKEASANPNHMIEAIRCEFEAATVKFPTWPTDPLHALAILGEEFGELTKSMLQLTYEPHKATREKVKEEAIQTAAMALRLSMSLDCYQYRQSGQHIQ